MEIAFYIVIIDTCFNQEWNGEAMEPQRNERGFTLIELLIVVAIIGILAAIAIPQYNSFRIRAYNASALSDLRVFRTVMESYLHSYAQYPTI